MSKIAPELSQRMSASMDKIVSLAKNLHALERNLNRERIALCMQILDWIKVSTDCGAVETDAKCYEFISQRTKLSTWTIAHMHRVAMAIEEQGLDQDVVQYGAVRLSYSYAVTPATKIKLSTAVRQGAGQGAIQKILMADRLVRESVTHNRVEAAANDGTLTENKLRIECLAVQTAAKRLYGQDVIVTITNRDYVPLLTVGKPNKVLV